MPEIQNLPTVCQTVAIALDSCSEILTMIATGQIEHRQQIIKLKAEVCTALASVLREAVERT